MKKIQDLLFFCIVLLMVLMQLCCQSEKESIEPLSVGDVYSLGYLKEQLTKIDKSLLVDIEEKLVILEFVSATCSTCAESVPHLQRLQTNHLEDVLIVLVTRQDGSKWKKLAAKHQWELPIIAGDTVLNKYFPYAAVPHQVWIKGQKVLAITGWKSANESNIATVLAGKELKSYLKEDTKVDFDEIIPNQHLALYQSVISSRTGVGSRFRFKKDEILVQNANIVFLYNCAFEMPNFPNNAYVKLEVNDSLRYLIQGPMDGITGTYEQDTTYLSWRDRYTFLYNLRIAKKIMAQKPKISEFMVQDLNRFFKGYLGIEGQKRKRTVKCLALVETDTLGRYKMNRNPEKSGDSGMDIELFVRKIAYRNHDCGIPIVNETGYSGDTSIEVKEHMADFPNINKELERYGLQFVEKDVEIDMVVITETNSGKDSPAF
ncbi:TlpA family protein disulfide reductase [Muricauda brasiliensis]|uniref:TlpA family protein disulfide reductase n=1 Tax=Muricauda brasiliensis TaxID=2162892 RepID=UPI000D3A28D2|nr:hypothetical protein [Muricauda brasiliensis]